MKKLITRIAGHSLNLISTVAPAYAGKLGFLLFCYPFRSPMQRYHKEFLQAAENFTIAHNTNTIQVYKWGNGKRNILFLHGWQSHSFRWKNFIASLSMDDYTIYALDAPGHGLSSGNFLNVPLYSEVIEALIKKIGMIDTVVAHSLGAFTISYTLHRLPTLPVEKVVLLASPGNANEFIEFYHKSLRLRKGAMKNVVRTFERVIGKPVDFFSASQFAASIDRQALIIHDEEDKETAYSNSVAIHSAWKNSQFISTKGLGHNLRSASIVQCVVEFISSKQHTSEFAETKSNSQE